MSETGEFHISEDELDEKLKQAPTGGVKLPVLEKIRTGQKSPTCVIVVGMAGSGKTTFMAQLFRSVGMIPPQTTTNEEESKPSAQSEGITTTNTSIGSTTTISDRRVGYFINLDPATKAMPFGASIDIRDTVDYKEVMKQHKLGPNGAILTSLNLFATKFDQVMSILEKRSEPQQDKQRPALDYIAVDTPGQIEAFTWSASGSIICEALASAFPTVLAFVVDTPRCAASPNTFMSNMLYACSMLYRSRLPLVIVFNKTDVVTHEFAKEWMTDYETFQEALDEHSSDMGYYGSLTRSLSLVLDEFYSTLHHVGVSAATGDGIDEFWKAVDTAAEEFKTDYVLDLKLRVEELEAKKQAISRANMKRLEKDMQDASIQE